MCGIAAIFNSDPGKASGAVAAMVKSLRHRGPDAKEVLSLPAAEIGHTRLSIIDLTGGRQPMQDVSKRFTITFNGEIYNFLQLRQELEEKGHHFHTSSDTEVLLNCFIEHREDAPGKLAGQFAFAIWDALEHKLFAARDRFGEKPFYFAVTAKNELVVASEIKAILASGLVDPSIDPDALQAYFSLLYVLPDQSIYREIQTLKPGHYLTWSKEGLKQTRYWNPRLGTAKRVNEGEAVEEITVLLKKAVARQMIADVPLGAFLSGGYDSSTIVALMAGISSRPVKTFSVGFGREINELPFARDVAQAFSTDHHEINMDISVAEMLHEMLEVYDEPFADSSNIPTYLISKYARQFVTVALSGDGGDELFAGYDWYQWLHHSEGLEGSGSELILAGARAALGRWNRTAKPKSDFASVSLKRRWPLMGRRHVAHLTREISKVLGSDQILEPGSAALSPYLNEKLEGLDQAIFFDLLCYLPGDILTKVDRASMACSLETRAPFLDPDLADFVLSLPVSLRYQNGNPKALLKKSMNSFWPEKIRDRKKQGFGAPLDTWLAQKEMQDLWTKTFKPCSPILQLFPNLPHARPNLPPQIRWTFLCLALWLEKHASCLKHH